MATAPPSDTLAPQGYLRLRNVGPDRYGTNHETFHRASERPSQAGAVLIHLPHTHGLARLTPSSRSGNSPIIAVLSTRAPPVNPSQPDHLSTQRSVKCLGDKRPPVITSSPRTVTPQHSPSPRLHLDRQACPSHPRRPHHRRSHGRARPGRLPSPPRAAARRPEPSALLPPARQRAVGGTERCLEEVEVV